jgi:hypothetical protein
MNYEQTLQAKDQVIEAQRETIQAQAKTIAVLETRLKQLEFQVAEFGTFPGDEETTEDPEGPEPAALASDDPDSPDAQGTDLDDLCNGQSLPQPPPYAQLHWDAYHPRRHRRLRPRPSDN